MQQQINLSKLLGFNSTWNTIISAQIQQEIHLGNPFFFVPIPLLMVKTMLQMTTKPPLSDGPQREHVFDIFWFSTLFGLDQELFTTPQEGDICFAESKSREP